MRTTIFTFLIFISLSVNGQTYYSFPVDNAKWIFNYTWYYTGEGSPDVENYTIEIEGDTLIDVTTYQKLRLTSIQSVSTGSAIESRNQYQGAIREDLANKKVYFVEPNTTTEILLYDFNLEVGDPVLGKLEYHDNPDLITSIDYVYVGSSYRKRWNTNSCYNISIIEGVGSTYGLFNPSPGCVTDLPDYSLTCFKQDLDLYPNTLTQCEFTTGLISSKNSLTKASVFPNPSKGSVKIDFNKIPTKEILLTDLLGNIFLIESAEGLDYVNIVGLKESIYILTLTDNNNKKTMTKIVSCP
jgi:hypothetical protein